MKYSMEILKGLKYSIISLFFNGKSEESINFALKKIV